MRFETILFDKSTNSLSVKRYVMATLDWKPTYAPLNQIVQVYAARKGVFMIDASKGFIKDGAKNRLREQDIHRIVDTFTKQADVPRYARMVPLAENTHAMHWRDTH